MTTVFGLNWQVIANGTERLEVIGGWIVKTVVVNENWIKGSGEQLQSSVSMVFVADSNHEWEVEEPKWIPR